MVEEESRFEEFEVGFTAGRPSCTMDAADIPSNVGVSLPSNVGVEHHGRAYCDRQQATIVARRLWTPEWKRKRKDETKAGRSCVILRIGWLPVLGTGCCSKEG